MGLSLDIIKTKNLLYHSFVPIWLPNILSLLDCAWFWHLKAIWNNKLQVSNHVHVIGVAPYQDHSCWHLLKQL